MKSLLKIGLAFIGLVLLVLLIVTYAPKTTDEPVGGAVIKAPKEITKQEKFDAILTTSKINSEVSKISRKELVELKSYAIKKQTQLGKFSNKKATDSRLLSAVDTEPTYEIEITQVNEIDGGVEVFARAWKDGKQLGFGKDGSVDIERFRIFNPPVLVSDPLGTVTREIEDRNPLTGEVTITINRFREDPAEALRQTLFHNVSLVGKDGTNIQEGKIGNTVDTYYPNAHTESTSVDGYSGQDNVLGSWATVRNAVTGSTAGDSGTVLQMYVGNYNVGGAKYWIYRSALLFDTSALGDTDTIDSATLSLYPVTKLADSLSLTNTSFRMVTSTPASNTAVTTADYDQFGLVAGATDLAISGITTGSYSMVFTLNATGLTWIDATGITKLGVRHTADTEDENPIAPGSADDYSLIYASSADTTGTTQDPKLIVTHTAIAVEQSTASDIIMFGF
jgi:hypothetical protein